MSIWLWVVIVVIAAIVLLGVAWAGLRTQRTKSLQEKFGPEYDRVAADAPTKRDAEAELRERADRRSEFDIRPLEPGQRDRYRSRWQDVQAGFVDHPASSVGAADDLIQEVMRERGYPVEDFETRSADLSVDYPTVVEHYRAAHGIAVAHGRGNADTEELRKAVQHYRALFDELLGTRDEEAVRR
jgi:hypothetical protein